MLRSHLVKPAVRLQIDRKKMIEQTGVISVLNKFEIIIAVTAVIALIISSVAVIVAIVSVYLQRKQNRLSLRPIANIVFSDYENDVAVKVQNKGLGPMTIERFEVLDRSRVVSSNLLDLMPDPPTGLCWSDFRKDFEGLTLRAAEETVVLRLSGDDKDPLFADYRDSVRKALMKFSVRVHYKDVYGEEVLSCERPLDLFGRHF